LFFRVNGRPAVFSGTPNVSDGDLVTLSGVDTGGDFKAFALRNDSTGVAYPGQTTLVYVAGILFLILGLPFSAILIGIPFALFGGWLLYAGYRNQQANSLLQASAPSPRSSVPVGAE
jgi:mannose/fructose/N-acetylgalactosamine-specific phosphotransferase system component IIC